MSRFFIDLFSGETGYTISDNMAVNEDGEMLYRVSDNMAYNADTGETDLVSFSWDSDEDDFNNYE